MVNTLKLKARIMEFGFTQKDVARALNIALPTVSQKLNNKRPMYLQEADIIANLLEISTQEFGEYFFTQQIA
ncbi:MAG: helix-turn-helix transcriptional regulator [Clostridium sp.]|jgi:transcriptional regulator with XRE-family HTH domain|nr:helix-turn-helix transcriptional regulator [Clostridium sp.]